jgi:hypothetical protein
VPDFWNSWVLTRWKYRPHAQTSYETDRVCFCPASHSKPVGCGWPYQQHGCRRHKLRARKLPCLAKYAFDKVKIPTNALDYLCDVLILQQKNHTFCVRSYNDGITYLVYWTVVTFQVKELCVLSTQSHDCIWLAYSRSLILTVYGGRCAA